MKKKYIFLIIIVFVVFLTGGRLLWLELFNTGEQPYAEEGVLDLREWDFTENVTLDGEWALYPYELYENVDEFSNQERRLTEVPGGWDDDLHDDVASPYGYGTYHLQILLNPENNEQFSLFIPSIRTAATVFINGEEVGGAGRPAETEEQYIAKNVPFTATFSADEYGVIDVVIQVANYFESRSSGLIRSIKFGPRSLIHSERNVSVLMQIAMTTVFIMIALAASALFYVNRNKKLLYFAALLVSTIIVILSSGEDKLLHYFFPMTLEWSYYLLFIGMLVAVYSIVQCTMNYLPALFGKTLITILRIVNVTTFFVLLVIPSMYIRDVANVLQLICLLVVVVIIYFMVKAIVKEMNQNVLLLLSLLALMNYFVWWMILSVSGIKVIFYPFDMIISVILIVAIWLRRYIELFNEQKVLTEQLRIADQRKDEFLVNTSHELRNPLHGILNISQAVLEREKESLHPESRRDLEVVYTVGKRMTLLLNDLIDVSRLQEGGITLHLRSLSVKSTVSSVIEMMRFMERKPITFKNTIPEHFPNVIADENRLIQILFNLLHNAVKFTNEGEVRIEGFVKNKRAHIVIKDTGIGMNGETMKHIFEPYRQAVETTNEQGIGVGLSISKQLIELHGGTIDVTSTMNKGSTFIFTLRIAEEETEREERNVGMIAAATETDHFNAASVIEADRPKILVIDDDPVNLRTLEAILHKHHYNTTLLTSAKEALALIDREEWDLVITDLMMPEMSGLEVTKEIRTRFSLTELPILVLTARNLLEDVEAAFRYGANDYVTKPVDLHELRARVSTLTKYKKSVKEQLTLEIAWLQAQIQPHFFFNTLNTIAAFSELNIEKMQKLLGEFGVFLQKKFQFERGDELITVKEEIEIVRSYLYIEKERYQDRLHVEWDFDETMNHHLIPPLSIQPLVENAIQHGLMKRTKGGTISIRIKDNLITIEDDGIGMDEQLIAALLKKEKRSTDGVGLLNVHVRLKRLFGQGLHIESNEGKGTIISFSIPKQKKEEKKEE